MGAGATIGPEGNVYVGMGMGSSDEDPGCFLFAFDGSTGAQLWCSQQLNEWAVTSSPTIDRDGNLYHGDNRAMLSFSADGGVRWSSPIVGFPISAQFTPDGHLLFMTHIGRIYVLDRETGAQLLAPVETIPGQGYEAQPLDYVECLVGSTESRCFAANTPAIDLERGRFFFSLFTPGAAQAALVAMRYVPGPSPRIEPLWRNETLAGGTASSPVISTDGERLYVADQADNVLALSAASGEVLWSLPLGFSPLGSLSVSPQGRIIPTGALGSTVMAIQDAGASGEVLWRTEGLSSRSIAVQASNDRIFLVGVSSGRPFDLQLFTIDGASGALLDAEPLPGGGAVTVGSSLAPSGYVYVVLLGNGLMGFAPD